MSDTVRPDDYVTLQLSDEDFRAIVANALMDNLIYTGGYRKKVTVDVAKIESVVEGNREGWQIAFDINVEEETS